MAAGCGADEEREPDLEALVEAFLADASRTALQLPHMTTGQRKRTKRLVERHPGLRCESFGLGQERQLHLLKSSPDDAAREAPPAHAPSAHIAPPAQLSPKAAVASGDPAGAGELGRWEKAFTGACSTERAPTEACSTGASTPDTPEFSPRGGGPLWRQGVGTPAGLATPLGIAAVRNTFIHFEGAREDDRLVRSLPHGMFRQQLWAEAVGAAERSPPPPRSVSPPPATVEREPAAADEQHRAKELPQVAAWDATLPFGVEVEIGGLSRCPAFNGRRGVVVSYDPEAGRYDVALWSEAGERRAKVRRENLAPICPPSPASAPSSPQALCGCAAHAGATPGGFFLATQSPGQILQAR